MPDKFTEKIEKPSGTPLLSGSGLAIHPDDILPPEAMKDPMFQSGQGMMKAVKQPALAAKYGVIRSGQKVSAEQLDPSRSRKAQDKKAQVGEALNIMEAAQKKVAEADKRVEEEAKQGLAGAAAGIGSTPSQQADKDKETRKKLEEMDEFSLAQIHEMMVEDIFRNDDQRKIIEERLDPIDIGEIISRGYATQRIKVRPGVFEPTFRTVSASEDLAIKRMLVMEGRSFDAGNQYLLDKYVYMGLACALHEMNGTPLEFTHLDASGHFDEDKFKKKFDFVMRYPLPLLASLGVQFFWFDIRVRKLFTAERLGNG